LFIFTDSLLLTPDYLIRILQFIIQSTLLAEITMTNDIFFETKTPLTVTIRTTTDYWNYVTTIKHRNMRGKENIIISTLSKPDFIRKSKIDESVFLYYKKIENYLYCTVVRHENGTGYLITTYVADKAKEGELIWTK